MSGNAILRGPSAEARQFLADPANRLPAVFDPAAILPRRAEDRAMAEARATEVAAKQGVSTSWTTLAGQRCLEITPNGAVPSGTLLFLYGGGFVAGGPLEDLPISAALAKGAGLRVLSPEYPLAPEHPFPAASDAVEAMIRAVAQEGPYMLVGESAGGNLALCAAQWAASNDVALPRALALMSPASDMSEGFIPEDAPDDPTLSPAYIHAVGEIYPNGADRAAPQLSPLFGKFGPEWPDTIISTGTRDLFIGPCARLERAIRDSGGTADLRVWDGLWHVFEYYPDIPEAAVSLAEIASFLKARL